MYNIYIEPGTVSTETPEPGTKPTETPEPGTKPTHNLPDGDGLGEGRGGAEARQVLGEDPEIDLLPNRKSSHRVALAFAEILVGHHPLSFWGERGVQTLVTHRSMRNCSFSMRTN